MLRGAPALLLVAWLGACSAQPPARVLPPLAGGAACTVRGRTALRAGQELFVGPERGASSFAVFTGGAAAVELSELASGSERRARATVRAGGFVLSGWVGADATVFHAARDVAVLEQHVWIVRGAQVRVVGGQGRTVRVEAVYTDFQGLAADADCGAVAFEPTPGVVEADTRARYAHLRGDTALLFAEPEGAALHALRSRRSGPTLRVLETRAGVSRVAYQHGVRVAGWIRDQDLAPGEGPDCDHCYGGHVPDDWDRCPDVPAEDGGFGDVDGCPDPATPPVLITAARDTLIRPQPSPGAAPIGRVERGAEVYMIEEREGWGRVRAKDFVVAPAHGADFWVARGDIAGP